MNGPGWQTAHLMILKGHSGLKWEATPNYGTFSMMETEKGMHSCAPDYFISLNVYSGPYHRRYVSSYCLFIFIFCLL